MGKGDRLRPEDLYCALDQINLGLSLLKSYEFFNELLLDNITQGACTESVRGDDLKMIISVTQHRKWCPCGEIPNFK